MSRKQPLNFLPLIFVLLFLVPLVYAQKTDIRVDGQDIWDLIAYMAADEYLGRKPLTPEFFQLHEWAANKFKAWGLEPAGENGTYFQAMPVTGRRGTYAFNRGIPKMMINDREFFTTFGDFSIDPRSTTDKTITGNLVFVGYGISAPEKGLDEYDNMDVKGNFVFVFRGSPSNWEEESKDSTKIMMAYEKGAAGIIFYNPESDNESNSGYRSNPLVKSPFARDFLIVSDVNERVYQWLFWKDPQESSRGFDRRFTQIRRDIKKKMVRSFQTDNKVEITGFRETTMYGEKFDNYHCRNVIAKIQGTDPVLKNEYVVLGGHFDHLGIRNSQIYNGADDNASGSAVVMEVARLMKTHHVQPKRSVIFCLWTGEELGLLGSRYWVKNPTDSVTMDRVVTYFNMDMVALGEKIGAPGALNFPSIWEIIKKNQDEDVIDAVNPREGGPGGSDHTPFIELGIESLALMTSGGKGHPDYHDTNDDSDKCDKEILRKTGQFVLQGTINVANEPTSLVIPDRQHIYDGMRWYIRTIDPTLRISGRWRKLRIETKSDLVKQIIDKIKESKTERRSRRQTPRNRLNIGIQGAHVFNYDIDYMLIAYTALGFGRIDIHGDDAVWFNNGLTEDGRKALAAMEDSSIVLNLVNPSSGTFSDVLNAANKSFLISGISEFNTDQISMINEKNVLVAVDFDPQNIDGCVARLVTLKRQFGNHDNLILNVRSKTDLKSAKKNLYQRLVNQGWTKEEIYAIGGSGRNRTSQGNLSKLGR